MDVCESEIDVERSVRSGVIPSPVLFVSALEFHPCSQCCLTATGARSQFLYTQAVQHPCMELHCTQLFYQLEYFGSMIRTDDW